MTNIKPILVKVRLFMLYNAHAGKTNNIFKVASIIVF